MTFGLMTLVIKRLVAMMINIMTFIIATLIKIYKLQQAGHSLGRVFNSRSGWVYVVLLHFYSAKRPNLKLKALVLEEMLIVIAPSLFMLSVIWPNVI